MKREIFNVRATKYDSALAKARKKAGKDLVVGDVRLKSIKGIGKDGVRTWQVVTHKRLRKK